MYLAQQARQLHDSQAAAAAPSFNAPAALGIQSDAEFQRAIAQHSPSTVRVPASSARGLAPQDVVSVQVVDGPVQDTGQTELLLYWHDIAAAGKEEGIVSSSGRFIAHAMVGLADDGEPNMTYIPARVRTTRLISTGAVAPNGAIPTITARPPLRTA